MVRTASPSFCSEISRAAIIVSRDGHVEVAKAYYSVPPESLGLTVNAAPIRVTNFVLIRCRSSLRKKVF